MLPLWLAPVALVLGLLDLPAAAASDHVKITKWQITSVQRQTRTVKSGAKVTFCADDPDYGITPFFSWAGVPFGDVMTLSVSQPRGKTATSRSKTFSASGENADVISAASYGPAAKSLPAGRYAIRIAVAGSQANGTVTLLASAQC